MAVTQRRGRFVSGVGPDAPPNTAETYSGGADARLSIYLTCYQVSRVGKADQPESIQIVRFVFCFGACWNKLYVTHTYNSLKRTRDSV